MLVLLTRTVLPIQTYTIKNSWACQHHYQKICNAQGNIQALKSPDSANSDTPNHGQDIIHENVTHLTHNLLYVAELVGAVSDSDFGCIEDGLPDLACIFCAAGLNNYSTEILHFLFNLKEVWTPEFACVLHVFWKIYADFSIQKHYVWQHANQSFRDTRPCYGGWFEYQAPSFILSKYILLAACLWYFFSSNFNWSIRPYLLQKGSTQTGTGSETSQQQSTSLSASRLVFHDQCMQIIKVQLIKLSTPLSLCSKLLTKCKCFKYRNSLTIEMAWQLSSQCQTCTHLGEKSSGCLCWEHSIRKFGTLQWEKQHKLKTMTYQSQNSEMTMLTRATKLMLNLKSRTRCTIE